MQERINILLIESDPDHALTIQLLFTEIKGCSLTVNSSCRQVLEDPPDAVPHLILLAHSEDSYAAGDHLRVFRRFPESHFVCSIPSGQEELVDRYLEAGANAIVMKSSNYIPELTKVIKNSLIKIFGKDDLFPSNLQASFSLSEEEESLSSILGGALQTGEMILHYHILAEIGEGGMGEVYQARDLKLGRIVAIKVLPPKIAGNKKMKQRLIREAQAASALNHPSIVTIHSIEESHPLTFIVMEYVEGKSLQKMLKEGPLEFVRVLNFGQQIAEALSAAHRIGVIHRDIKPANIIITGNDRVKLLDFGLAKRISKPSDEDSPEMKPSDLTGVGTILGTVMYMSPEQTRGDPIDERSDIFSLGSVLYEAATGKLPFNGPSILSVMDAIARESFAPPSKINIALPPEFDSIIDRALKKDRNDRYASASEIAEDLSDLLYHVNGNPSSGEIRAAQTTTTPQSHRIRRHSWTIGTVFALALLLAGLWWITKQKPAQKALTPIRSLAVLPLLNLSGNPEDEYLADGLTESLIAELAKMSDLRMISRTSAMHYKGTDKKLPRIAEELNVDVILEGSVLRSGNRVRITAQLIHAPSDTHLWAENYERSAGDIFDLQSELAREISNEIQRRTSPHKKQVLKSSRTVPAEAYEAYLRGLYQWNKRTKDGLEKSIGYFNDAIEMEPGYALAYSALADAYQVMGSMHFLSPEQYLPATISAAKKAVQLDDTLAEAHTSLAAAAAHEWRWAEARSEYQKAIKLNPNYATAHHWYSILLLTFRDCDGSLREIEKAKELDPVSFIINLNFGKNLFYCNRLDEALTQFEKTKELAPNHWALSEVISKLYQRMGRFEDSIRFYEQSLRNDPRFKEVAGQRTGALRQAYRESGTKGYWEAMLQFEEASAEPSKITQASYYALLNEKGRAFECLEEAYRNHDSALFTIQFLPEFNSLRSDPRFTALIKRIGF